MATIEELEKELSEEKARLEENQKKSAIWKEIQKAKEENKKYKKKTWLQRLLRV